MALFNSSGQRGWVISVIACYCVSGGYIYCRVGVGVLFAMLQEESMDIYTTADLIMTSGTMSST